MTIEKYKHKTNAQSNREGKYATSTENRKLMWEYIIWPFVLELNKSYFTLEEYRKMRDKVSIEKNIVVSKMAGGMVSLLVKGILTQQDYEIALREVRSK